MATTSRIRRVTNTFALSPGTDFFGYRDADGDDMTFNSDFAFEDQGNIDTWGVALRIEHDINDDLQLTAISDFKDYENCCSSTSMVARPTSR